jgi:hypothetical protein
LKGGEEGQASLFVNGLTPETILLGETQLNKEPILFDEARRIS